MAKPPASSGSGANDPGASGERTALPTRQEVLTYLAEAPGKLGKRELARAFGIKGDARAAFKDMLRDMAAEGMIAGNRKEFHRPGKLPARIVVDVIGTDDEGDLIARPANPAILDNGMPPLIRLVDDTRRRGEPAVGVGDGLLIKPAPHQGDGMRFRGREVTHSGAIIRRLERDDRSLLGIFRHNTGRATPTHAASIEPVEKKNFRAVSVRPGDDLGAADGDLVRYQMALKRGAGYQSGRVVEVLGNPDDQRQLSLIAIHAHGLRNEFSPELRAELDHLPAVDAASRVDLTELALITIDPPDARDHDDAVHAIADTDPGNPGGHILTVAIADVAHYVRPGTLLDQEALARGNSVYFPDRVVPMLPEKISNDLCSLREGEVRPCLAVRMVFDASGTKRTHRFMRAIMRSHAKLSYDEAQAAIDAGPLIEGDTSERAKSPIAAPDKAIALRDTILAPLWRAYFALAHARRQRGPLELDLPERKIIMDDKGGVADIHVPQRLDAHRLIEECMIQANVAAAETLESARQQLVYRCHEGPSKEKHIALRDFLETIDLDVPASGKLRPAHFNGILVAVSGRDVEPLVNEVILRSQSQAEYVAENVGHFGLNLERYAHFTSPIRRYADLIVHRALIACGALARPDVDASDDTGTNAFIDGLPNMGPREQRAQLSDIATRISQAERRAMLAERETIDRLIASHLEDQVGARFAGRISGVTRSGLFVKLDDTGADGFIPISTLGDEYFTHVPELHALVGERSGLGFRLGMSVQVRLDEALPMAGALRFAMLSKPQKDPRSRAARIKSGRPPGRGGSGHGTRGRTRRAPRRIG